MKRARSKTQEDAIREVSELTFELSVAGHDCLRALQDEDIDTAFARKCLRDARRAIEDMEYQINRIRAPRSVQVAPRHKS